MIILVLALIAIVALVIVMRFDSLNEVITLFLALFGAGSGVIAIIFTLYSICLIGIGRDTALDTYQQRYKTIEYALENGHNVNLIAKEIYSYNSEVLRGRRIHNNIWLFPLEYDFFNELPLIELEVKNE